MRMPKEFLKACEARRWSDTIIATTLESHWEFGQELMAKQKPGRVLSVSGWTKLMSGIAEDLARLRFRTSAEMVPGFLESRIAWIIELIGYQQLVQKAQALRVHKMHLCEVDTTSCQRTSQDDNSTGCEA